jgi:hypothetical protein
VSIFESSTEDSEGSLDRTVRRLCDYCENDGIRIKNGDCCSPEWLQLSNLEGSMSNGPDKGRIVEHRERF